MAWATFGTSVDVIVGGDDLTYPHHAYQCSMVEAASGVAPFARRQVHVGAVHKGGRKMAKSTGNMTLVGELLAEHRAAAVRLMIINRVWHRSWEYDESEILAAEKALDALYEAAGRTHQSPEASAQVVTALLDDLDVPRALSVATEEGAARPASSWRPSSCADRIARTVTCRPVCVLGLLGIPQPSGRRRAAPPTGGRFPGTWTGYSTQDATTR